MHQYIHPSPNPKPKTKRYAPRYGGRTEFLVLLCCDKFHRAVIHQPAKVYVFQLHLRTRRFVRSRISSRPACRFPRSCECPQTFVCNRTFRGWRIGTDEDKLISCTIYAIFLGLLIKLEFLAQQIEQKCLMLNTWWRLFHSTRVKLPLVTVYAGWCLVPMYPIWIFGSKLILSNNESKATLWVLDTRFIVGLRPLLNILITDSLSSKTYNIAPNWEDLAFDGTWSTLLDSRLLCLVAS